MKSGVKFIASSILKKLELSNITFSGMRQISLSDTTNILIELGGIDLNTTDIFDLSQISISNSTISLLHLSNIYNANLLGKSISLFNISYYDSLFQFQDNLIKIDGIETNNDFKITIKDITISGITFVRGGNLILFQQQTSTILTVSNTLFLNNNGGSIHFEAYNKNNPNLTTNMQFENMTIQNSNGYYQSLIKVTSGATISIYNSSFINNWNYVSGGVASVDSLGTSLRLYNSTFMNNTSLKGGVFDVEDQGLLVINNWILQNNFGVQSGVIQCSNEGYFQLYSSIITDNFAYSVSLSELFLSSTSSEINNSTIQNNLCLTKSYITQQLNNCSNLWFFKSDFKLFLSQNNNLMDITSVPYAFELISSSLSLTNSTSIENQDYLSGCFQSNFTISDSIIKSTSIQSNLIYLSSTSLTINNVAISNITRMNIDSFVIFALLESLITVTSVEYKNYSWGFLNAYSVQFSFKNFTMISGLLSNYLISLVSWTDVSISNSNIRSLESSVSSTIYSSRSSIDLIQNISLSNLNTVGFEILGSNITQISQLFISDTAKGMILKDSNILNISNSEFISWGSQNVLFGGAIDIIDSSVTIQNSTFSNNNAQNGGAISVRCISFDNWENRMSILNFKSNQAGIKGGAIYYNFRRPEFDHIYYNNNIAPYGPNIASYSVKIVEQISNNSSMTFRNVPSGIKYDSIINLILQDYDNQTIPDSSYQIKISPITNGASVLGYDSARAIQGNAVFNNLVFILSPGNKNVQFKATSNAINYQINNAIGISSYSSIDVSFRFWMPGESQISKTLCQTWAPGTYSLDWNSTSCNDCVTDATCSGGSKIEVNPGSWRISSNSTTILNWPYLSSCLGGYVPENVHPVSWEKGYTSYLWAEWDIIDGNKYQKVSGGKWTKWPNPALNALKFIGVVLAAFIFLIIMIILILRKKRENQMSILIRILTNYLQLISLSLSFGLKFPDYLTQSFSVFDTIGSSSDTFLSYDWFFTSIQITGFTPSVSLFKILLTGLLPLMLFMVLGIIWIILYFALYKWFSNLKLNLIVSIIWIIFLLHPTITKYSLEVFEWIVVDANDKRMKLYMNYKWYSADHFKWISFVALPILICWVIGAPSIAFVVLYKYRKNLEGPIKSYRIILLISTNLILK